MTKSATLESHQTLRLTASLATADATSAKQASVMSSLGLGTYLGNATPTVVLKLLRVSSSRRRERHQLHRRGPSNYRLPSPRSERQHRRGHQVLATKEFSRD